MSAPTLDDWEMEVDVVIRFRRPYLTTTAGLRAFGAFVGDLAEYARTAPSGFTVVSIRALGDVFTPPTPLAIDRAPQPEQPSVHPRDTQQSQGERGAV